MRKIYNELFYIPKHEKIRDKVMLTRVITTVVIIVASLFAMSFSAYAYFSHNVSSSQNRIKMSSFEAKVRVQLVDENGADLEITSVEAHKIVSLKAGEKYFVTVEHSENSTANTGFIILTANDEEYHTQQLGRDGNGNTEKVTFWLSPADDTTVSFLSHWGTSSYYGYDVDNDKYIKQDEDVVFPTNLTVDQSQVSNDVLAADVNGQEIVDGVEEPATSDDIVE